MTTRAMLKNHQHLGNDALHKAFQSLAIRLQENHARRVEIVVCGGAALWAMSHDVSVGFAAILKDLLGKIGYCDVADEL